MKYATERHGQMLEKIGFEITGISKSSIMGQEIISAIRNTDRGSIEVYWGENGTAIVIKPNGSIKWHYQKQDGQICRALKQTIEANTDIR